jgi:hypothetical protein
MALFCAGFLRFCELAAPQGIPEFSAQPGANEQQHAPFSIAEESCPRFARRDGPDRTEGPVAREAAGQRSTRQGCSNASRPRGELTAPGQPVRSGITYLLASWAGS